MNYQKALSLYRSDKALQLLRAEHFPLLVSFLYLAFKQQDRISYLQGIPGNRLEQEKIPQPYAEACIRKCLVEGR